MTQLPPQFNPKAINTVSWKSKGHVGSFEVKVRPQPNRGIKVNYLKMTILTQN